MWQRVQTLYFILIIFVMIAAILLNNADFYNEATNTSYKLDMRGVVELNKDGQDIKIIGNNPVTIIFGMILFLTTYAITLYKNRRKQMRMATLNLFLLIIYIGVIAAYVIVAKVKLEAEMHLYIPATLPVVALILNYLAMRGIAKDEKLIRSMDRLR